MYDLLLGIGGDTPGVRFLWAGRSDPGDLWPLPRGHSVYAMDVVPDQHLAAVGTRSGAIHLLSLSTVPESDKPRISASLVQGAPVLAVCLFDDGCLASTDTLGRCLLWSLRDRPGTPVELETEGGRIGSLLQLGDGTFAGLSERGYLCAWNGKDLKRLRAVRGPTPSRPIVLARIHYWPEGDVMVYPAENGWVAFCNLREGTIRAVPAHRGAFHAIVTAGCEFLTIGAEDGMLKTWRDVSGKPARTQRVPVGIVSAEMFPGGTSQLLLVGSTGEAGIFTRDSEILQLTHRLEGGGYRVVVGPSSLVRESRQRRALHDQASALRSQIQAKIDSDELDGIDELLDQLKDPGFEPTVLAIRAQLAAKRGDLAGELAQRHRLAQLLPLADGSGIPSLQRYAALLESVWQLAAAREIHARIKTTGHIEEDHEWINCAAEIMSGTDWVAVPVTPISGLVQAATVLDQHFRGSWLLRSAKPMAIPVENLTAEAVAEKYEQIRSEKTGRRLPIAQARTVWWLAPHQIRQAKLVVLAEAAAGAPASLCPALQVQDDGLHGSVTPMLLLSVAAPKSGESVAAHHRDIQHCLETNNVQTETSAWPPAVRHAMGMALRRLQNQAKARLAG